MFVRATNHGAGHQRRRGVVLLAVLVVVALLSLAAYQYSGGVWHAVYGPVPAGLGVHGLSDNRTEGDGEGL